MSLPAREQRALDGIEIMLQAGEARLTSMFVFFTYLSGDEEKPGTEELGIQSRRLRSAVRATGRYLWSARRRPTPRGRRGNGQPGARLRAVTMLPFAVAIATVAATAAVLTGVSASSAHACGPAAAVHRSGPALSQARICQSSRPVPVP